MLSLQLVQYNITLNNFIPSTPEVQHEDNHPFIFIILYAY